MSSAVEVQFSVGDGRGSITVRVNKMSLKLGDSILYSASSDDVRLKMVRLPDMVSK